MGADLCVGQGRKWPGVGTREGWRGGPPASRALWRLDGISASAVLSFTPARACMGVKRVLACVGAAFWGRVSLRRGDVKKRFEWAF